MPIKLSWAKILLSSMVTEIKKVLNLLIKFLYFTLTTLLLSTASCIFPSLSLLQTTYPEPISHATCCTTPPLRRLFRTVESERDSGKFFDERFKMADISAANRRLLEISICALLREQGFSSASKIALETLTEMLQSCKQSILSFP